MDYTRYIPQKALVDLEIFEKLDFQVGTIQEANFLLKAKKPSFEFTSDFGNNYLKKSCGQFVANYKSQDLINKQIFALTNLKPVRIAGVKSDYLTLGFNDKQKNGQAIAITPVDRVDNGLKFNLKCEKKTQFISDSVDYEVFDSLEVKSATIIDVVTSVNTFKSFIVVYFGDNVYDIALVPGYLRDNKEKYLNIQIPVITNLKNLENPDIKCLAFTIPIDNEQNATIMKKDKKVENNLPMF
jgi:tRNA-binding protein